MDESARATDEELAERAKRGDEVAFRQLFDRYAPALRAQIRGRLPGLLRRKVGESDVVQMAYLGVYRGLADFEERGEGSFRAWLDGIVEHKILYVLRQYVHTAKRDIGREETGSFHQGAPNEQSADPSPSSIAVAAELRSKIETAMSRLPPHYREVIDLVQREGLTLAEAGARMEISGGAAEKIYGRALAKLAALARVAEGEAHA